MPTETSVLTRCITTGWPSLRERWEGGVVLVNTELHLQVINGCLNVTNVKDHVIIYTRQ